MWVRCILHSTLAGCWEDIGTRTNIEYEKMAENTWLKVDYADVFGYTQTGHTTACRFRLLVRCHSCI